MSRHSYSSIQIKSCRSCSSKKLKTVLDLGELYLSDFTRSKDRSRLKKYPLTLVLCSNCNLVQLKHTTPPEELYNQRYGYRSGINTTMREELKDIVTKSQSISKLKKGELVIDIGANDGTLLSFYKNSITRVGFEPVRKFAKECRKHADIVINDYFGVKKVKKNLRKAKIITAISMFYDLNNPNNFLKDVSSLIDDNGVFVIQQNYLVEMLKQNGFDNIVHEHLEYYSLASLEHLLINNGFRVFDVELSEINGGSIRTYICKAQAKYKDSKRLGALKSAEKDLKLDRLAVYNKFAKNVKARRREIRKYMHNELRMGRRVFVYGASTRGNTLLQYCGLDSSLIAKAVERNPEKWGKYITSVGIPIISEEKGRSENPENMLVLPWFFKEEFLKREEDYIKNGGKLIFPLPKVQIVSL